MYVGVQYDAGMNQVRRERRSASEWPALLEQWTESGESAARFASRIGVKPATLARWRKAVDGKPRAADSLGRQKKSATKASSSVFARVEVVEPPRQSVGLVEVVMRGGLIVRVHGGVDTDTLSAVLACVAQC